MALEWQRAWADNELGYELTDEDRALLQDALSRPDDYMRPGRPSKPKATSRKRRGKPYRLPATII